MIKGTHVVPSPVAGSIASACRSYPEDLPSIYRERGKQPWGTLRDHGMGCRKQGTTTRESAGSLSVDVAGREGQKPCCGLPTGATRLEKLELMGLSHMPKFCWLNFVLTPLPGLCSAVPTDNHPSAELYLPLWN